MMRTGRNAMRSAGIYARNGALGKIRTPDPQIRSLVLYQLSYERFVRRGASGLAEGWRTIGEAPGAGKRFRQHLFLAASGADGACVRRVSG